MWRIRNYDYKYSLLCELKDLTIMPRQTSSINSRSECSIETERIDINEDMLLDDGIKYKGLPLITAPMASVVSDENYNKFLRRGISPIIPRNIPIEKRMEKCETIFCAFSLKEVKENFLKKDLNPNFTYNVLIDIANGHMFDQIETGFLLKQKYGKNINLMGGNIANPNTIADYDAAGFDYIRVGIGGGSACITGTQTGVYFPMGSLLSEIVRVKEEHNLSVKIIADGGINDYSDIIKALALGADYVMLGRIFGHALEACGDIYNKLHDNKNYFTQIVKNDDISKFVVNYKKYSELNSEELIGVFNKNIPLYREYYGMSTKKAQAEINSDVVSYKTSEGKVSEIEVLYTLDGWLDNFNHYLKSAMSYCDSKTLNEFVTKSDLFILTNSASIAINSK